MMSKLKVYSDYKEQEPIIMTTVTGTMVIGKRAKEKEQVIIKPILQEHYTNTTVINMKANGETMILMEKANINIQMAKYTMEIGKTTKEMEKVLVPILMVKLTMEIGEMIRKMAEVLHSLNSRYLYLQ